MVSDLVCSDLSRNVPYNEVPSCTVGDLVGHVRRYVELSVAPAELELIMLAWY